MSSCLGEAYDLRANRFYLFSLLIICITVTLLDIWKLLLGASSVTVGKQYVV